MGNKWKYDLIIQQISEGLFIALLGVLAGWMLSIEIILTLSFIVCISIAWYFWGLSKGGGSEGDFGVIYFVIPAFLIFIVASLITGLIVHWNDLIYMLRSMLRYLR